MRTKRQPSVLPSRLALALVTVAGCGGAGSPDVTTNEAAVDTPVGMDLVDTADVTALDAIDVALATDATDASDDSPDCSFACIPRQAFVDGSVVNYVLYPDGFTDPDAVCDAPPPSDPRCILAG